MKSLEIANKIQNDFNECFSKYDVATMTIIKPNFYAKEWEQIKADLEVLEILKKNIITIQSEPDDDYGGFHDDMFEIIIDRSFKTEDFHKVKQWLEEN